MRGIKPLSGLGEVFEAMDLRGGARGKGTSRRRRLRDRREKRAHSGSKGLKGSPLR